MIKIQFLLRRDDKLIIKFSCLLLLLKQSSICFCLTNDCADVDQLVNCCERFSSVCKWISISFFTYDRFFKAILSSPSFFFVSRHVDHVSASVQVKTDRRHIFGYVGQVFLFLDSEFVGLQAFTNKQIIFYRKPTTLIMDDFLVYFVIVFLL